ncbi:MAG TPA: (Fe-S)-binding protein [Rhizomicrobium sp.]|nr:(Fe-S)-binding protein [Rhizomicrobium sp.]
MSDAHKPKVGLFVTCLVDLVRPQVGFAAIKLLERAGCDVVVPKSQTCCGQPAWNSGANKHAADIARQVVQTFEHFDYIVAPSGSCAGTLRRHYPEILKSDPQFAKRAEALAAKTYELMQFLSDVRGLADLDVNFDGTLTYHDSCSSLREMGVKEQPRKLLGSLSGAQICELKESEVCCGFGGLFAVKYSEISERMADDKIADAVASGASTLTGADLGCLLHLAGRMKRRGIQMEVRHAAEILVGDHSPPLASDKTDKP